MVSQEITFEQKQTARFCSYITFLNGYYSIEFKKLFIIFFKYNLHLQKSGKFGDDNGDSPLLVTETQNYNRNAMKSSPNAMKNYNTGVTISKKQYDHSNYWKIVVQDYAKKLDDSAREKDFNKEQAIG